MIARMRGEANSKRKREKVLVIGGGAREHALIWALKNTGGDALELHCTPGNGGISEIARCHPVRADDMKGLRNLTFELKPDLVVIGPEAPLVAGITDVLSADKRGRGFKVVGPTRAAARLEGSKWWAKEFMWRHNIPTANAVFCNSADSAFKSVEEHGYPLVIKGDGLCGGKGVTVAENDEEALAAIDRLMVQKKYGAGGESVLIEEKLEGKECSFRVLTDGMNVVPFKPATDFKRRFDGDEGPNTGGMGCHSPVPEFTPELENEVMERIVTPTVYGMAKEGNMYRGFLYFGLMLTKKGPFVLEYNVRMGDPEEAATLPLLQSNLYGLLLGSTKDEGLAGVGVKWSDNSAVCVVVAAEKYPGEDSHGETVTGIADAEKTGALVFHAGTDRKPNGEFVTAGGRILDVVGIGRNFPEAAAVAYAGAEQIRFNGMDYRQDIALEMRL